MAVRPKDHLAFFMLSSVSHLLDSVDSEASKYEKQVPSYSQAAMPSKPPQWKMLDPRRAADADCFPTGKLGMFGLQVRSGVIISSVEV